MPADKVLHESWEAVLRDRIPYLLGEPLGVGNVVQADQAGSEWQAGAGGQIVQEGSAVVLAGAAAAVLIQRPAQMSPSHSARGMLRQPLFSSQDARYKRTAFMKGKRHDRHIGAGLQCFALNASVQAFTKHDQAISKSSLRPQLVTMEHKEVT